MIHIVSKANDNQLKALILVCWGSTIIAETNKGQGIGGPIHYCKIIDFSVLYFFTGYPESSGLYYRELFLMSEKKIKEQHKFYFKDCVD